MSFVCCISTSRAQFALFSLGREWCRASSVAAPEIGARETTQLVQISQIHGRGRRHRDLLSLKPPPPCNGTRALLVEDNIAALRTRTRFFPVPTREDRLDLTALVKSGHHDMNVHGRRPRLHRETIGECCTTDFTLLAIGHHRARELGRCPLYSEARPRPTQGNPYTEHITTKFPLRSHTAMGGGGHPGRREVGISRELPVRGPRTLQSGPFASRAPKRPLPLISVKTRLLPYKDALLLYVYTARMRRATTHHAGTSVNHA